MYLNKKYYNMKKNSHINTMTKLLGLEICNPAYEVLHIKHQSRLEKCLNKI